MHNIITRMNKVVIINDFIIITFYCISKNKFYILEHLWLRFRKLSKDYYPIYKMWYVTSAMVMIQHPDDIKVT